MTGVLLLLACAAPADGEAPPLENVDVEQMAMEAVFQVRWSTPAPATASVVCRDGEGAPKETKGESSDDGLDHTVLLAGLGASTTWTCLARSGPSESAPFTIDSPAAPAMLPGLDTTIPNTTELSGFALITQPLEGPSSVAILDREGRRTWWYEGELGDSFNEAWLAPDGQSVWFQSVGEVDTIHHMSLDGSVHERFEVPEAHHDFYVLPDGGFLAIRADTRPYTYEGQTWDVQGDEVVEYDDDGNLVRVLWNAWDELEVDPARLPPDGTVHDWTHANCIYPAADNTWLISLWSLRTILRIRDEDGSKVWQVGGASDFEFLGTGDPFKGQHGVRLQGDILSVFNNRNVDPSGPDDLWSEAVEFKLDEEAMTYERHWSYDADRLVYATVLGEVDRLANGHRFIGWGGAGRLTELDADGQVVWQVDADLGGSFGYAHILDQVAGAQR